MVMSEGCADPWHYPDLKCPCCGRQLENSEDYSKHLISAFPQKKSEILTECEVKKEQYQWMFVKKSRSTRYLTTSDLYGRLMLQHRKHKESVQFVLQQLVKTTNNVTDRVAQLQKGHQNYRQQDVLQKKELHKYKENVDVLTAKLEDMGKTLDRYRRTAAPLLPSPRGPPMQRDHSRHGDSYSQQKVESIPPSSSRCTDGRSTGDVDSSRNRNSRPELAHGSARYDPLSRSQHPQSGQPSSHTFSESGGRQRPESARGQAMYDPPTRSQYPQSPQNSVHSSSSYGSKQHHPLPEPTSHHRNHHYLGNSRKDQHRNESAFSPQNPYERSMNEYSRTRPTADHSHGGTPMSQRYDRHQGHYASSIAGTPSSKSSGGIHQITKDTPYSFSGGVQKVRKSNSYGSGRYERGW